MYSIGAAPAIFQRLTSAAAAAPPSLPAPSKTVTTNVRPIPGAAVLEAERRATAPSRAIAPLSPAIRTVVSSPRGPAVMEPRPTAPTTPMMLPRISPTSPVGRILRLPVPSPVAPVFRPTPGRSIPNGATTPVPPAPIERVALAPAPAPAVKPLPASSPFRLVPGAPVSIAPLPAETDIQWLDEALPGAPAADPKPSGKQDPLDTIAVDDDLSEQEIRRLEAEAAKPTAAKPSNVVGAVTAIAFTALALWIFGRMAKGGVIRGGKAGW